MLKKTTNLKSSHSTNVHYNLDNDIFNKLERFCAETKMSRTAAVENAINMYVDNYDKTGRVK